MAIVYSYPKVTSPLATDVLVLTDTTVTAGKRKNKTKSIAMSDVATYVINTKSGITGSGTVNKFPIFTASTVVGDSIITQAALGQGITVGGGLDVTNDTNLQGSLLANSLEVTNDSVFTGSARFNGTIKDTSGGVGTNGQVLTSTGTGVAWATDAGGSVTGTGTTNYIAKWNTSSSIQNSIIFDNGTNVGIGTTSPQAKLHINSQQPLFVTDGNEVSLSIDAGNYIYKIGDISGGENQSYMQIDSAASKAFFLNSNVGIGTNSPVSIGGHSGVLTLYGSNATALALKDAVSEGHLRFDDYNFKFTNSGGTVRMQIEADTGNVGIGTNFPTEKLDIYSDGNAIVRLESAGGGVGMLDVGTDFTINNRINTNLIFKTSNVERMRITNNGSVGIGTTNPSELLHVQGNNATIQTVESGGATVKMRSGSVGRFGTYSNNNLLFVSNSQDRMTITSGGNVGIGTASPASKLEVDGGDIEVDDSASGLILRSPNGTRYRIQVDNSGNLTTTAV